MKKILYIICAIFALTACNKEELTTGGQNPDGSYTFNIGIEEPDYVVSSAPKTRATVTMTRYLLEMYEGSLSATPVKMESTDGVFNVELKKGVDYVCLFWADGGAAAYDATSLKAVKQTDETKTGTAAYCAGVTVNSKTFNGAVTLKRAVAELSFIDKNGLTEETNTLKITYPYASTTLNVGDGTVTYAAGTAVRTITGITPPAQATNAFTTDFILAPKEAGKLTGLKFQLNSEAEKTIAETAVQANFKTKITGEYESLPSMSFTIDTRKDQNDPQNKTFEIPFSGKISGYELIVDWGDGSQSIYPDGTVFDVFAYNDLASTHIYSVPDQYQIRISSTQTDETKVQMPKIDFGGRRDRLPWYSSNSLPISIDTPLLNMGNDFSSYLNGCVNLTTIPASLFEKNVKATTFEQCFSECESLSEIPEGLFAKNTEATNFASCFRRTAISEIPASLFEKNVKATTFDACFERTNIKKIPTELFAENKLVSVFSMCFAGCKQLASIPPTLFENNTEATKFEGCFQDTAITEIPPALFAENKLVISFNACFYDCSELTSIPAVLFAQNKLVEIFAHCFSNCPSLTAIPSGLFANNTEALYFESCFSNCTKIVLNPDIFCNEATEKDTRFAGKTMTFQTCFQNCGSDTSVPVDGGGIAPELWTYTMENIYKSGCYRNATKVSNVNKIPSYWK